MMSLLGILLGWLCAMTYLHGRRIRQLQEQSDMMLESSAKIALCRVAQVYLSFVVKTGRCPDCRTAVGEQGIIHTEDCRARKIFEDAEQLFGKEVEDGDE